MPLLLTSPHDKSQGIDCLKLALSIFVMKHISPAQREAIQQHVAAMEANAEPMNVDCHFETFPSDKETKVTLTFKHGPGEFVNTTDELIWEARHAYDS